MPELDPGPVTVGFAVNKVALEHVFLEVLWFSALEIILLTLHVHTVIYDQCYIILATDSIVK